MKKIYGLIIGGALLSGLIIGGSLYNRDNKVTLNEEKLTLLDNTNAKPQIKNKVTVNVSTVDELKTALGSATSDYEIVFGARLTVSASSFSSTSYVIDGKGATFTVPTPFLNEKGFTNSSPTNRGIFLFNDSSHSLTLKNAKIMGGSSNTAVTVNIGAKIQFENVTITRSKGALSLSGSGTSVVMKNCYINRNASARGGGINNEGGYLLLDGCSITQNRVWSNYDKYGRGGGINIDNGGYAFINNTIVANNTSSTQCNDGGAGIYCNGGHLYIMNSSVTGNYFETNGNAQDYCYEGAGIRVEKEQLYVVNSIVSGNYSTFLSTAQRACYNSDFGRGKNDYAINVYNSIYGSNSIYNTSGTAVDVLVDDKVDTTNSFAAQAVYGKNIFCYNESYKDWTSNNTVGRPAIIEKTSGKADYYTPVKVNGNATSGGTKTYLSYSIDDLSATKMGFYYNEIITALGDRTAPNASAQVLTYFGNTARADGVIGACEPSNDTLVTLTPGTPTNGSLEGISPFYDTYVSGTNVLLSATPNSGYGFAYWTISGVSSHPTDNPYLYTVTTNKTITPVFGALRTLTYDLNGGSGTLPTPEQAASGATITISSDTSFTKEGYAFNGWNTKADGTGTHINAGGSFTISADTTIYVEWGKNAAVLNVENLISQIGTVEHTTESKAKIDAARGAYNLLTNIEKPQVSNYLTLTAAETMYDNLVAKDIVEDIIDLIDIGEYSSTNKAKIDAARDAYDNLTSDQKALVDEPHKDLLNNSEKVYESQDKIELIGNSYSYTPEFIAKVQTARAAYNALDTAELKAYITNYDKLVAAETWLSTTEQHVSSCKALINAIGTVEYNDTSKAKIDAARTAYNALTQEEKNLVGATTYKVLTDAEATYAQLELNATRHELDDTTNGVRIETNDGIGIPRNIDLRVDVKTDVKASKGSEWRNKIDDMLKGKGKISDVFDVKLIQTIDGVETEIQPADIEEGMKIIVHIEIPEGLDTEKLSILHIHSEYDMEYIENFKIEGNEITFEADRFSEFAFIVPSGLPGWAIALIVIGSFLILVAVAYVLLFFVFNKYIITTDRKIVRAFVLKKHHEDVTMVDMYLRRVFRKAPNVYNTKEDAENALKNR